MFTAKRFSLIPLFLAACLCSPSFVQADEVPLKALQDKTKVDTPLGTWELTAMAPRKEFPFFTDKQALSDVGAGRYDLPVRGVGTLQVTDDLLSIRICGFHNNADEDKWIPMVTFTAKDAQKFTVTGQITNVFFDGDKTEKDAIQWAVLKMKDGPKFKVIATATMNHGDNVDFAKIDKLASVDLAAGESIAIVLWRPSYWHSVGGEFHKLTISKAPEKAADAPADKK